MGQSKVYLASDHAGFELKGLLAHFLLDQGYEVEDLGPHTLDPQDDYPDFIKPLAKRVAASPGSFGIVIGGSGEGEAMAANRVAGARAAEFYGPSSAEATGGQGRFDIVKLAREHNNANILSLGARFLSPEEARRAVLTFLTTPFSGEERHVRRIEKLDHEH